MTVAKEPFTGESSKQAVKPLRREGRNAPAALYARVHFCLRKSHARPRVQQAPGLPCALSSRGGQTKMQTSGAMRREKAKVRLRRSYGAAGGQEVRLVVPPTIQPRGSRCLSSIGLTHPPLASMPRCTWFLN